MNSTTIYVVFSKISLQDSNSRLRQSSRAKDATRSRELIVSRMIPVLQLKK